MTHYIRAEIGRPCLHALIVALAALPAIILPSSVDAGKTKAHSEYLRRTDPDPSIRQNIKETDEKAAIIAPLNTLEGHTKALRSAEFSPDGKTVVTASEDKMARVWDSATGNLLATMEGHSKPIWIAVF